MDENKTVITDRIKRKLLQFLFFVAALFLLSFAVLFLWNATLPKITQLSAINYWQAIGLLLLFRLLFGGFNFGRMLGWQRWTRPQHSKDLLIDMGETDKAAFKEEWKKRFEQRKR